MARKNKRSQLRKPQRGGGGAQRAVRPSGVTPIAPTTAAPDSTPTPAPAPPPPPAPAAPSSRLVQRPLPRGRGRQQAMGPLPAEDAAIPLDRVPYFRADVLRIALTAAVMFVLLIVGSFVLRGLLQA